MNKTDTSLAELDLGKWQAQLRKGALGLAVLATLCEGRAYGLEILRRLDGESEVSTPEGTIYPLLSRLQREGLVLSQWETESASHPRKYYALTERGRSQLAGMTTAWRAFARSMDRLIAPTLHLEGADAA